MVPYPRKIQGSRREADLATWAFAARNGPDRASGPSETLTFLHFVIFEGEICAGVPLKGRCPLRDERKPAPHMSIESVKQRFAHKSPDPR